MARERYRPGVRRSQGSEQGGAEGVVDAGVGFAFDGDRYAFGLKISGERGYFVVFPQEDGAIDVPLEGVDLGKDVPDLQELRIDACVRIFSTACQAA